MNKKKIAVVCDSHAQYRAWLFKHGYNAKDYKMIFDFKHSAPCEIYSDKICISKESKAIFLYNAIRSIEFKPSLTK